MSKPTEFSLKPTKNHERKKVDNTMYTQIVGNLMYLTTTSLNIMYVVSLVSKYMEFPKEITSSCYKNNISVLTRYC